jgi:hypothetical protein
MAGVMSSDAGIFFFDCLPGVTSLCIEQKFVGDLFGFLLSHVALEFLTTF